VSVRTHWAGPRFVEVEVVDEYTDSYGSTLDDGNYGLVIGHEEEVFLIEGSLDELEEFADEIKTIVQKARHLRGG
jgi:hypothetical protein